MWSKASKHSKLDAIRKLMQLERVILGAMCKIKEIATSRAIIIIAITAPAISHM